MTAAALVALVAIAAVGTAGAAAADRPAARARVAVARRDSRLCAASMPPSTSPASSWWSTAPESAPPRAPRSRAPTARAWCARFRPSAAAPGRRLVLVRSGDVSTAELRRLFAADPAVARVSPNYIRRVAAAAPDDPGLVDQWGLLRVNAPDAWEVTTGSPDVVVASIDTGVDLLHPDLAANVWRNPGEVAGNGVDDDANGYVDDLYGIDAAYDDSTPDGRLRARHAHVGDHGRRRRATGPASPASRPASRSWRVKFLDRGGSGSDADAIESHRLRPARAARPWRQRRGRERVVGRGGSDLFLRNAIAALGDAGIVFVASAGNDDEDNDSWPSYPAAFDCTNIIAVAATNKSDKLSWFSNYGDCTRRHRRAGVGGPQRHPGRLLRGARRHVDGGAVRHGRGGALRV